jgi:uncharacterized repeat protein (TIGR01451 family)
MTGGNNLQNFPVITSVLTSDGTTTISGTLNSTPNTQFFIEFFSNPACDTLGNGEGQTFLGSTSITTDANGNATFQPTLATATAPGQFITATATALDANSVPRDTSEFSACRAVAAPPAQVDLSLTKTDSPDPAVVGGALTYTITVGNNTPTPSGTPEAANVVVTDTLPAGVSFNSASSTQGSCAQTSGTVTCNLGALAFAAQATVTINVTPTAVGSITNTASVTSDNPDPNSADNTASAETTVQSPTSLAVTNTADSGAGSLRQAILDANTFAGVQTIAFNISGAGVQTIAPTSPLPDIIDAVIIDGYTQPGASRNTLATGSNAVLTIALNGVNSTGRNALTLSNHTGSTVRGLVINTWADAALLLSGGGGHRIQGNFMGTSPDGTTGVFISIGVNALGSSNNLIGTDGDGANDPGERNLISADGTSVFIQNAGADNNFVAGNYIGTNATGDADPAPAAASAPASTSGTARRTRASVPTAVTTPSTRMSATSSPAIRAKASSWKTPAARPSAIPSSPATTSAQTPPVPPPSPIEATA